MVGSFIVILTILYATKGLTLLNLSIGSAITLVSNLVFVISGLIVPAISAPGRMVFPHNITFPLIFCAWMMVVFTMTMRLGNPLTPTLPALQEFAAHFDFRSILWVFAMQVTNLSVAIFLDKRTKTPEGVDSE